MTEPEDVATLVPPPPSRDNNSTSQTSVRPHRAMQIACGCVLMAVMFERTVFYSIYGNLVMVLNMYPFYWHTFNAVNMLYTFTAVAYVCTLFGAWIADTLLGRFKMIAIAFIVYIIGYAFLATIVLFNSVHTNSTSSSWCSSNFDLSSNSNTDTSMGSENCVAEIFIALFIIGLSCGVVKVNLPPFGADQVRGGNSKLASEFFTWFYWCINVGALLALGPVAYVQQAVSLKAGYTIPLFGLILGFIVFLFGIKYYGLRPPLGSVLTDLVSVITNSITRRRCCVKRSNVESDDLMNSVVMSPVPPSCLDGAKITYGGRCPDRLVDDVKYLLKILLLMVSMIPFWIIYFQMSSTFLLQGLHMKFMKNISAEDCNNTATTTSHYLQIPAASLSLFNVLFIIVLLPLTNRVLYPALRRRGINLNLRQRIIIGMITAVIAVLCAGFLENRRLNVYWQDGFNHTYYQKVGISCYYGADLSILWQIPQYLLIGVSEVFASVAAIELCYLNAPVTMRSVVMALFWTVQGLGSTLTIAIMTAIQGHWLDEWDRGDINGKYQGECHMDYYFYTLGGLGAAGVLIFGFVSRYTSLKYLPNALTSSYEEENESRSNARLNARSNGRSSSNEEEGSD